jgi:hypothetical protein
MKSNADSRIGSDGVRGRHRRPGRQHHLRSAADHTQPAAPGPSPSPFPGGRRPGAGRRDLPQSTHFSGRSWGGTPGPWRRSRQRACAARITDEAAAADHAVGRDLDPATANIADELSRQCYLSYASTTEGRPLACDSVETRDDRCACGRARAISPRRGSQGGS